jgi:hypothetical protein
VLVGVTVDVLAAATIRAQLEQQGTPIGSIDVLIAGDYGKSKLRLPTYADRLNRCFDCGGGSFSTDDVSSLLRLDAGCHADFSAYLIKF